MNSNNKCTDNITTQHIINCPPVRYRDLIFKFYNIFRRPGKTEQEMLEEEEQEEEAVGEGAGV